jgi:hypothetical protein
VYFQKPAAGERPVEVLTEYTVSLEPPGRETLFRLESQAAFFERLRQEALNRVPPERIEFPPEPVLSKDVYLGRSWPQRKLTVEPNYVCYGKLLFEDKNAERYGWDLGVLQPFVSAGLFFFDVGTLPYHCATDPLRRYECSAGYCLPGDPVPYSLYPVNLSVSGAVAEVGVGATLFAIFP